MRKVAIELIIRNLKGIVSAIKKKNVKQVIDHIKGVITILEKEITQEKQEEPT